jgi:hypothetical protein
MMLQAFLVIPQGLRMKKLLTSTFRGLSAESSDVSKFLDPAVKQRDVEIGL